MTLYVPHNDQNTQETLSWKCFFTYQQQQQQNPLRLLAERKEEIIDEDAFAAVGFAVGSVRELWPREAACEANTQRRGC